MGVHLALLSLLVVVVAGGGEHTAVAEGAKDSMAMLGFSSASEVMAYWQSLFPNAPMPPALLDRFKKPAGGESAGMTGRGHFRSIYSDKTMKGEANSTNDMPLLENAMFPEDAFSRPGSVIDLYIDSSATLRTACENCETTDYVPMSPKNLTDIINMFAPISLPLAHDIWSSVSFCAHAHRMEGEKQVMCTRSLKSMVAFAESVLGTSDLRTFSSFRDVPAEGVTSPSQRYEIVAVRPVTTPGASATTMTCHSMEFPDTAYYCHAVNPTRVYEVTLQRKEGAPVTMRALTICHLDTSGLDPKMPFFVDSGLKPGDAAACHFLSRGSVLWAATSWTV